MNKNKKKDNKPFKTLLNKDFSIPNIISLFRFILTILMIVLFSFWKNTFKDSQNKIDLIVVKMHWSYFIAFLIFIVVALLDFLDGFLARKLKQITVLGKLLDPIIDKIAVLSILLFLTVIQAIYFWTLFFIFIRVLVINLFRMLMLKKNIVIAANIWGKVKTYMLFIAIIYFLLLNKHVIDLDNFCRRVIKILGNITLYTSTIIGYIGLFIYVYKAGRKIVKYQKTLNVVFSYFTKNNLSLAAAESLTGGLFSNLIIENAGASKFFKGAVVCYSSEIKTDLVGINKKFIKEKKIISVDCVKELSTQILKKYRSDVAIAFTGNSGPEVMENKPCGLFYIGIKTKQKFYSYSFLHPGNRMEVRSFAAKKGLEILCLLIKNKQL